ncbi:MAG: hypothetical protein JWO22_1624 [Frankiales bacterium]|nr:hypothetical protein [Frankiales bacterium]
MRLLPPALVVAALLGTSLAAAPATAATPGHHSRYSGLADARAHLPLAVGHPASAHPARIGTVDRRDRVAATGSSLSPALVAHQQALRAAAQPNVTSGSVLSTWDVTFEDPTTSGGDCAAVTTPQRDSFNRAVDIWAHTVASSVTITVDACFHALAEGQLGGATAYDFQQFGGVDFPNALANSLTGENGNATLDGSKEPDILAEFSNSSSLYYFGADPDGIEAACPSGCYDFESVALHELGHGLGFIGSVYKISAGHAAYGYDPLSGDETPFIYDLFAETSGGSSVVDYPNKSSVLYDVVTSNQVYWNGPEGAGADRGREPRLFAPIEGFLEGSSYSHLDYNSYPTGDADSLMTPYAEANDVTRDPGEVMLGMFRDMGWVTPGLPGASYTPLANPVQVLDWGIVNNGGLKDVAIAGSYGVPANATAVVLNLTAAAASKGNSQLFAYAKPRAAPLPPPARVPNLVAAAGYTKDGLATVPLGAGAVRFRNVGGSAHNYAAVVGYFTPTGGTPYASVNPHRVVDTRTGTGTVRSRVGTVARTITLTDVPSTAVAVALDVTGINPSNTSTVQVFSSDLSAPQTGNVHTRPGQSATNLVIVKLGADHGFKVLTTLGSTDVVADLVGWYDASAGGLFRPVLPQRVWGPTKVPASVKDVKAVGSAEGFGVPAGATSLVLDTVASFPSATTFLSTYATGVFPGITTLTVAAGKSASGASLTKPSAGGNVRVKNAAGTSTVSLDLFGYYAP